MNVPIENHGFVDLKSQGFRFPAEWEPHEATWVSWPHKRESWPGLYERIPSVFSKMVAAIAESEPVCINVNDAKMEAAARRELDRAGAAGDIRFYKIPTDDAWCRDHGALFLVHADGRRHALDFRFNAWGEKYPPFTRDDDVARLMAETLGIECTRLPWVLEGGSIDVNGQGTLLTTRSCLLNPNRNPHLSQAEIARMLRQTLGVDDIVWLNEGIAGDDTDGHIDDMSRFVSPDTVVTAVEENHNDENYPALLQNLVTLKSARIRNRALEVVTLPMPQPVVHEHQRLPASYANFYIANSVVLLPTYQCAADDVAGEVLSRCFQNRRIIPIDCTELVWGLGAFHCLTQQIPAVASA